ncbi:hypothetical protein [Terriglobus roseus]|uniref:Uncharacterized protein n=1 Tax=Terriglobus roseus TaxID=392734 RepID=A0A1G7P2U2_9BACT|nr:hypothetical protein [Terriglobus roseus]SDF79750.1 hypothetical protein SAMN05444167_3344 [Terriglobus roseus]
MGIPQKQEEIGVTTVEPNDYRHLVQPYKDRPTVELKQGEVACPFCGNPQFRRSRLRFMDLFEVLMLRYPVRCTRCAKRQFTDIYIALLSYPAKFHGGSVAQGDTSWKEWTDRSTPITKASSSSSARGTASHEDVA